MSEINKGYIPGRYINLVEEVPLPAPTSLPANVGSFAQIANVNYAANFRSTPPQSAPIIGTIPKGTIIYLIYYNTGWYQVNYNGKISFVSSRLITLVPTGKYVTLIDDYQLNIRNNPTVTATILGILKQKEYAEIIILFEGLSLNHST